MAKMGRPRIEIDQEQFEKLCEIQCTEIEICDWFACSEDTINRWCKRTYNGTFAETYGQKRGTGRISLRRMQWHHAEKNPAMAIFLGKQYLDQSDGGTVSQTSLHKAQEILGEIDSAID